MISVDTVYQKVLALANKEQRGYITPQEFNLLADKAQMELYDMYFHDIKTGVHKATNQQGVAFDEIELIQEKLQPFQATTPLTLTAGTETLTIPDFVHYINILKYKFGEVTEMTLKEVSYTQNHPLLSATQNRMVYVREPDNVIRLRPILLEDTSFVLHYYKRPKPPEWAYVVVNSKALYNSNSSVNFTLHGSEEELLVARILQLAGIIIMKPGIVEIGSAEISAKKVQQNN